MPNFSQNATASKLAHRDTPGADSLVTSQNVAAPKHALFQACLSRSCRAALEWLQVPSNPFLSFQQVPSARTFASSITLATR